MMIASVRRVQSFRSIRVCSRWNVTGNSTRNSRALSVLTESEAFRNINQHRQHTVNDGFVWNSPYESVSIPDMTIDQYVWKNVAKWENHIAIVCAVTGRKYTYAKLRDHCATLAIRLRESFRLQQNDIVAICLPNVPGTFVAQ